MKYIKKFETHNTPIVGDYIIYTGKKRLDDELRNYLKTTIGKISVIYNRSIYVTYENIPQRLKGSFYDGVDNNLMRFDYDEILQFGKKTEMESIIAANKFNL